MKIGEQVLYTIGALLGIFSLAYFGTEVLVGLSPEIKALLLFLLFVVFLLVSTVAGELEAVTYALSGGAYLVFLIFVLSSFGFSTGLVFLLLAGSSVLLIGLGYLEGRGHLSLDRRTTTIAVAGLLLVGGGAIAVDALGPQPTYETTTVDELSTDGLNNTWQIPIGETRVTNDHFFSRSARLDGHTACIYDGEQLVELEVIYQQGDQNVYYFGDRFRLGPGETQTITMAVDGYVFQDENGNLAERFTDLDSIPVTTAESCPSNADEPQIIITPGSDSDWWGY